MLKRKRSHDERAPCPLSSKRSRIGAKRGLLQLSDELLLRVLSSLTVRELIRVERVSRRMRQLATDSEVWKSKFFDMWISSRARRIPPSKDLPSAIKLARWLEHGTLLREDPKVDWKRQYRLKSNWEAGAARVQELEVAKPSTPPVLAKVNQGVVFTVDAVAGLRAWSQRHGTKCLIAHHTLDRAQPTSIAVDSTTPEFSVAVGYASGRFDIFEFGQTTGFGIKFSHDAADNAILSLAVALPYVLTMSDAKYVRLYQAENNKLASKTITLLSTLHSDASYHPAVLSLRQIKTTIVATIAYPFSRLNAGWCIGLQELRLSTSGGLLDSRLASTLETPLEARYQGQQKWEVSSRSASSAPFALHPQFMSAPTSLAYSHPFLIASLADNTIMSYMVTSDDSNLKINSGRRLWGHTSAVSGAAVSNRGKAVSVSARGHEIRVWELEETLTSVSRRHFSTQIKSQPVDITQAMALRGNGLGLALVEMQDRTPTRRWVGFDEEQVVVLGERDRSQIMSCYDFT